MSDIRTPPATEEYREGWERIFGGKKKENKEECPFCSSEKGKIGSRDEYCECNEGNKND